MLYFTQAPSRVFPRPDGRTNKELQLPIYPRQGRRNRYQTPFAAMLLQYDTKYAGEECLHVIVGQSAKNRKSSRKAAANHRQ